MNKMHILIILSLSLSLGSMARDREPDEELRSPIRNRHQIQKYRSDHYSEKPSHRKAMRLYDFSEGNFSGLGKNQRTTLFSKGIPVLPEIAATGFKVNEDGGYCNKYNPDVAMNSDGSFVVVWGDQRDGGTSIYIQRYNSSETAQGDNFRASPDTTTGDYGQNWQYDPCIGMDASGNFVVAWADERSAEQLDIYAQRFNSSGTAIGNNFMVSDGSGSASNPDIAVAPDGDFVVTWTDRRDYYDIYFQQYDSNGNPLGTNQQANEPDSGNVFKGYPAVAMDADGDFTITWEKEDESGYDTDYGNIYFQRFSSNGTAQGVNNKVNDDSGDASQYEPDIATDDAGNFVITWYDYRNGHSDIYFQRVASNGTALGNNELVNDDDSSINTINPSIAMNRSSGDFTITWNDYRNGNWDIYYQNYYSSGTLYGSNMKVNDDSGTEFQYSPAVAIDSEDFIVVWTDERSGYHADIYGRHLSVVWNSDGQKKSSPAQEGSSNFRITDDEDSAHQWDPKIDGDDNGNHVIIWTDFRNDRDGDIYGQRYTSSGTEQGNNFMISEFSDVDDPHVAVAGNGNFVVVWADYRNDNYDIYGQRYSSSGTKQDDNFLVNDDGGTSNQYCPSVAIDDDGNFIVVWADYRNGNYDIYGQYYDFNGTAQGNNILIGYDSDDHTQYDPDVAMMGDFLGGNTVVVAWEDYRNDNYDIYAMQYDLSISIYVYKALSGINPLQENSNFKVNDDGGTTSQSDPDVAIDSDGRFVIVWEDQRDDVQNVYGQCYASSGDEEGSNFKVNATSANENIWHWIPRVDKQSDGKFTVVWQDAYDYKAYHWDIVGQIFEWDGDTASTPFCVHYSHLENNQEYPDVFFCNNKVYSTWRDSRESKGFDIYASIYNPSGDSEFPIVSHTATTSATYGEDLVIEATITDNDQIDYVRLYSRKGGEESWSYSFMSNTSGNTYNGKIHDRYLTEAGVEYYIEAVDNSGNTTTDPASNPTTNPHVIQVSYSGFTCPNTTPAESYRMISVPGDLDNSSISSVLGDDLGSSDRTEWRLLRGENETYLEYGVDSNIDGFEPGNAFWLITKTAKSWDVGSGTSISTASSYTITLTPGWNQIGNPFAFNIAWSDISKSGNVENPVDYAGSGNNASGYSYNQSTLIPWKGYCVKNLESTNVTLAIPGGSVSKTSVGKTTPAALNPDMGEWQIQIQASCAEALDKDNFIGCLKEAETTWDVNDFSEAPPIGDYVSLYFPHPEWERYPGKYTGDFRPPLDQGEIWDFVIRTSLTQQEVTLSFENLNSIPEDLSVILIDITAKQSADLRKISEWSFLSCSGNSDCSFRIIVGNPEFIKENSESISHTPQAFELLPNYPNPFNAATTIQYTLPEDISVKMTVYDLLGRKVRQLANGKKEAGYHHVIWRGEDDSNITVPSGIYIVRLKAGDYIKHQKLVLTK